VSPLPEPIRTPADRGWLTTRQAVALLAQRYGVTVSVRTLQGWTRDDKRPLRSVHIGRKILVHRDDLLVRIGDVNGD
jgi:hypothetical protein